VAPESRSEILRSLRAAQPPPVPLPDLTSAGLRFPDSLQQFARSVGDVGGKCVLVASGIRLEDELARIPEYASARKVVSLVAGVAKANVALESVADAHELEDVDFCVLPGLLGVAENGAVWVTERGSRHRAAWFLAQHLALVLPASAIVHDMHQAYERLPIGGPGFAAFISGPSKTADIEQSLVMGAQGPRSCTVFVIGGPSS
jgi:L-lactate dehydrogenase complex protein LldG